MGWGGGREELCYLWRVCGTRHVSLRDKKMCLKEHCPSNSLWALAVLQPTLTKIKFGGGTSFQVTVCDSTVWVPFMELNCHNGTGFGETCGDLICT